ncbi:MAG TPA: FG-GAP repeat protein, partial [Candidatus Eisenbacteria bacterium]|nr:FG-GAP repeat protein [Candidatus Eisenbacteria bacterium]
MSLPRRGLAAPLLILAATFVAAIALVPTTPAQAAPLFQADFESYDAGATQAFLPGAAQSQPTGVAAGDMNGDGLADLVVACPGSPAGAFTGSTISVLLRRTSAAVP